MSVSPSSPKVAVFTIISNNYSAYARVLLDSLASYEPGWDRWVLLVDAAPAKPLIFAHQARVKLATELPLPAPQAFFTRYDILEANTAVKPWMLEWLFQNGYEWVVYLDPDIRVFSPLLELTEAFAEHSVILTPHITQPFNDEKQPDELLIKRTGVFNLGFGAFRNDAEGRRLVKWWQGHLAENCVNALGRGIFVDQSWMNFCPAYCNRLHVLKHPGYNAAYWNLHYRPVSDVTTQGLIRIAGREPLRFYHFSGFDYRHPERLSKHQNRFSDGDLNAELRALLQDYADALVAADIKSTSKIPYGLAHKDLPGRQVAPAFSNPSFKPVFHPDNAFPTAAEWRDYLLSPDPRKPALPVALANVWFGRSDLREAFPLDTPRSLEAFCEWFEHTGRAVEKLPADFPAWGWWAKGEFPPAVIIDEKPLVTVYGYFEAVSGMGEAGRSSVRALERMGYPHRVVNFSVGNQSRKNRPPFQFKLPAASGAIDLIHVNCDQAEVFLHHHPEVLLPGRYRIAYWAWEKDELPPLFYEHAARFDEIWCLSNANAHAFRQGTKQPVRVAWPNLDLQSLAARTTLETLLPLPAGTRYFLVLADFHSFPERKGPLEAVQAYCLAFPATRPGVALVVKAANTGYRPAYWRKLEAAAAGRSDIIFLHQSLSRETLNRLVADALALVSLHAQEGFGLPIAEAIALETPVVCTNYGGNTDFCTPENSHLVPYELIELAEDLGPYRAGTKWARPSVTAAADFLRVLADSPARKSLDRPPVSDPISARSYAMYEEAFQAASLAFAGHMPPRASAEGIPVLVMHHHNLDQMEVAGTNLHLAGWANIDVPSMSRVKASAVVRGGGREFIFPLQRTRRLDVAVHFKTATQLESGFHGILLLAQLAPGSYELDIHFESPLGRATWATGRRFSL